MLKPFALTLRLASSLAFVATALVLLVALLPFFQGAGSYAWVRRVIAVDSMLIDGIRSVMPTRLGRLDLARAFLSLGMLFAGVALDFGANSLTALATGARRRSRFGRRKERAEKAERRASVPTVGQKKAQEKKSREELVRLMVEAKRELEAMTKEVAFLALDVVESTNMKLGEDPAFVEHDFREFKKMVEGAVRRQRPLKSAWTPDGAMICFDTLEGAIAAAQAMLKSLPDFNARTRMMGTPFRVRCGINAGAVQYDAATPMEEMSDNVIDVAGHMQKYADPDTIFVASDLLSTRRLRRGFDTAGTEVDGYEVSVWRGPSADRVPLRGEVAAAEPDPADGADGAAVDSLVEE